MKPQLDGPTPTGSSSLPAGQGKSLAKVADALALPLARRSLPA